MQRGYRWVLGLGTLVLALAIAMGLAPPPAQAQQPKQVDVGLLVPLSGLYARFGAATRIGAEMAVERINAEGGIKALGGAKLNLIVLDCGDTAEKAKSAAQQMVSDYPNMVAVSGSYLSTLTLATSEVTERAHLPMLTLSYSDVLTSRGFQVHLPDLGHVKLPGGTGASGSSQDREIRRRRSQERCPHLGQ